MALPGELYPELWLSGPDGASLVERPDGGDFPGATIAPPLSSRIGGRTRVTVNLANDAIGYIIPKTQYDVDAPHAYLVEGQYGEGASLGYESAPAVEGAVVEMMDLVAREGR